MTSGTVDLARRWGPSTAATVAWLLAVVALGLGGRVVEHGESALTMLFGSFLAGSSPEGGGAVAFPVFTKGLGVPAPVARTFGLSIQAVGMMMASLAIIVAGRPFHRRAVVVGTIAAVAGFLGAVALLGRSEEPFWPPIVSTPVIKATFSIVLATTSFLMLRQLRLHRGVDHRADRSFDEPPGAWTRSTDAALVGVAAAGGALSALTGTGANIVVFLFLVVVIGVLPKTALPSAIMVMAAVSVVGFVLFVLVDGQFDLVLVDDRVVAVAGQPVDLAVGSGDLLGLWLAAVPVVVWGAPLGSLAASLVREHHLVRFVALLAAVEVATTVVLVPELRSDPALLAYLVLGLLTLPALFVAAARFRRRAVEATDAANPSRRVRNGNGSPGSPPSPPTTG
ncbi:MAG: TSUP family transporter [Actinomycetota bacterium]